MIRRPPSGPAVSAHAPTSAARAVAPASGTRMRGSSIAVATAAQTANHNAVVGWMKPAVSTSAAVAA